MRDLRELSLNEDIKVVYDPELDKFYIVIVDDGELWGETGEYKTIQVTERELPKGSLDNLIYFLNNKCNFVDKE